MANLLEQKCTKKGHALSDAEVKDHLAQSTTGWQRQGAAIEKRFVFENWLETMAFVHALAWMCHVEDHHPEITVAYDRCTVRFSTHEPPGISMNDFICAAKADALVAFAA